MNTPFELAPQCLKFSAFSDITSEVGNDYHNHHGSSLEFTSHIPRPHKVAWHTIDVQLNRFYLEWINLLSLSCTSIMCQATLWGLGMWLELGR